MPDACSDTSRKIIYLVHLKPEDYLVDVRGHRYDRSTYYSRPEMFNSVFYQRVRSSMRSDIMADKP